MTWRDNLRPASFRGVAFHVDDRKLDSGRRLVVHEFPKRNTPYPEDMGKRARRYTVEAYLVGDDYMARRDALMSACERSGTGQYRDHWGRSQSVVCDKVTLLETRNDGRYCRVSMAFVEAGAGALPVGIAATAAQLATTAGALSSAAMAAFRERYDQ